MRVGGVKFFLIESVAATVEVKSRLSASTLRDGLAGSQSVKDLDRSGGGNNYIVAGGIGGVQAFDSQVDASRHEHQVFTAIVGATGIAVDAALRTFRAYLSRNGRSRWPNTIVAVDGWSLQYGNSSERPPSDPMAATAIQINDGDQRAPVVDLIHQMWSFLRVTPVIDVQPAMYLPVFGDRRIVDLASD